MDEVKNDYIKEGLKELIPILGIKEFIDHQKIITLIESKKVKEAIKGIALYLGLPIEVNIDYGPLAPSLERSEDLVRTESRSLGLQ